MDDINSLKERFQNLSEQREVLEWSEKNLRPLAENKLYSEYCKSGYKLSKKEFNLIQTRIKPFVGNGTPGHDRGHQARDAVNAFALIGNDPLVGQSHQTEIAASLLGSIYHDIATGIINRYTDNDGWVGHAEIGAWLFSELTTDILPKEVRLLAAHAIASHTHLLKPTTTKIGFVRQPWEDSLFFELGHPVRSAVWVTRFTDRLDTNGVSFFIRYLTSMLDGIRYRGENFSGGKFFPIDEKAIELLLKTNTERIGKTPTGLRHVIDFAESNNQAKLNHYNQHDHRFTLFSELIGRKTQESYTFVETVTNNKGKIKDQESFWKFIQKVSMIDLTSIKDKFDEVWESIDDIEKGQWSGSIESMNQAYDTWLDDLERRKENSSQEQIKSLI